MSDIECPICMDNIDITKNCITTECGHRFHASCMMRNVIQNGFGCPMCRTVMAEDPEDEDEDEDEDEETIDEDVRNPDDFALRGLRLFMDNLEGVPHDREDEIEEQEDMEDVEEEAPHPKPSAAYIAQKLLDNGTTMEDLVKILLLDHNEYDAEDEEFDRVDERVWGEMRILIDNFQAQHDVVSEAPASPMVEQIQPNVTVRQRLAPVTPVTQVTPLSEQAEDKPPANVTMRQRRPGIAPHLDTVSRVLFVDEMEE